MKVLLFENNLIWSTRLSRTLKTLNHEAIVLPHESKEWQPAPVAIVNLSYPGVGELVASLKTKGTYVIGHAGHKERELLASGAKAGCNRIASNSELTFKLDALLAEVTD